MVLLNPLLLLVALADFASLALTQPFDPISAPSLARRSEPSYNAPNSPTGTFLERSSPDASLSSRGLTGFPGKGSVKWCAPGCSTYILVLYHYEIAAGNTNWATINTFVANAQLVCKQQIANGDAVIPHGGWLYGHNWVTTFNLELLFYNSNNHQLTWGVNDAALVALAAYFNSLQAQGRQPGAVSFAIVDGANEVARAGFGLQGTWSAGWR